MAHSQPKVAPVGEWDSPITSALIVASSIRLGSPVVAPDGSVFWNEGRPTEGGRQVLVRRLPDGSVRDMTPGPDSGLNVRTRVHEYGGGEFLVTRDAVYFSNFKDQRMYRQALTPDGAEAPAALTSADSGWRYADAAEDAGRGRLVAVREDHSGPGEAVNTVVAIDTKTGENTVLVSGADFYASPRLSPDGRRLAWVSWDHPNMPWDDTELWVADVAPDGSLSGQRKVAGGKDESVMQPVWAPDGSLFFISDRTNWWNIYQETAPGQVRAVCQRDAEFASPPWLFGARSYRLLPGGAALLAQFSDPARAADSLAVVDVASGAVTELDTGYFGYGSLSLAEVGGKLLVATVGSSPARPSQVALLEADAAGLAATSPADWRPLRSSSDVQIDAKYLSEPRSIEFPTNGGQSAYLNCYPPANGDFALPAGQAPPLLVKIHGGPTSQASTAFSLPLQYWTSRGFAIADVNYGGSSGYGRQYRNRLRRSWGVVDVDDCCAAARHLADRGEVDPQRLCIDGGSAGGYTTLACLAFRDVFSAGASHYGVADLELLAKETHKFESRYLDGLIGRLPQDAQVYHDRSPIHALDKFTTPCAFFQGTEDEVVPPNQAQLMFDSLAAKGVTTALVMFPGEQHGFRGSAAIRRALDGEWFFYGKALGFDARMPDDVEPIDVVNV